MIIASEQFKQTMVAPVSTTYARIELLDKNENLLERFDTKVIDGSVSVDKERDVRRQFNLTVLNDDGTFTWSAGGRIWIDKRIKLYVGLSVPKRFEYKTDSQADWSAGTLTNVSATAAGNLELVSGQTSGNRVSTAIELDAIVATKDSKISWSAITPAGTGVIVETSVDDGVTWLRTTNGDPIPGLPTQREEEQTVFFSPTSFGTAGPKKLLVRQTLTSDVAGKTPQLQDLTVTMVSALIRELEYVPQGVFLLSSPTVVSKADGTREVQLSGGDKWKQFDGQPLGRFLNATTISAGVNIADAIRTLASDAGETKFVFDACTVTVPYDLSYKPGDARGSAIKELAELAVYSIYYDVNGYLRFRPRAQDLTAVSSTWTYDKSDFTTYAGSEKVLDESELFNKVLVIGGSMQTGTVSSVAADTNSGSPISTVNVGERLFVYNNGNPDPLITTTVLAQARADYELQQHAKYLEKQRFDALPNYLHEAEDVITLEDDWTSTKDKFELIRFNFPLKPGQMMTGECWRVRKVGT